MLPEISIVPCMLTNFASLIKPSFKKDLDSYLKNKAPVSFLSELCTNLQNTCSMMYNFSMQVKLIFLLIKLILLLRYVGTQSVQFTRAKGHSPRMGNIAHSSHRDIFQNLTVDMEGRYLFLNCIANQLRYPNSHTH